MKIAIIADTHFGVKNDSPFMLDYQEKFFEGFFKDCRERGVEKIVHLGDFFDRRRHINFHTLNRVRKFFLQRIRDYGMTMDVVVGNHDCFFKDSIGVNSVSEIFCEYPEISVIDKPVFVDGIGLFCPWINDETRDLVMEMLDKHHGTDSVVFGHFEIAGIDIGGGSEYDSIIDKKSLAGYRKVFSGHYHTHNEYYVGSPYQLTWGDYGDDKGYVVLDTVTGVDEFVVNKNEMYVKVLYNSDVKDYVSTFVDGSYKGKVVRIIVEKCDDDLTFAAFLDMIEKDGAVEVSVVNDVENIVFDNDESVSYDIGTVQLIEEYVDALGGNFDKDAVKEFLKRILMEAEKL